MPGNYIWPGTRLETGNGINEYGQRSIRHYVHLFSNPPEVDFSNHHQNMKHRHETIKFMLQGN